MKRIFSLVVAAIGAVSLLAGCATGGGHLAGSNPNPVAHRPHNPNDVRVDVSLSKQQVYVMEGDRVLLAAATNIGIPGKSTPTGHFRVFNKLAEKRSGSYGFWVRGNEVVPGESGRSTLPGGHYVGYPMPWWVEFSPAYGFHEGYVWPVPRTHGCLRLHHNVAPKFYELVKMGTPVNIAYTQPEDQSVGTLPRPHDYNDPDPAGSYMISNGPFQKPSGSLLQD